MIEDSVIIDYNGKKIPVVSLVLSIITAKAAIKPGTAKQIQSVPITELPRTAISGIPTT